MRKLAVIRQENNVQCPFGLPITEACKKVGHATEDMQNLNAIQEQPDEVISKVRDQNLKIYSKVRIPGRCLFAAKLFKTHPDTVDCNFGDTAAGFQDPNLTNISEFDSQVLNGQNLFSLYTFPFGYVSDSYGDLNTNLYYGINTTTYGSSETNNKIARIEERMSLLKRFLSK